MRALLIVIVVVELGTRAGVAFAQPSAEDQAMARSLYVAATGLRKQGKLKEACPKYQESLRLHQTPGAFLNVANCLERDGKIAQAYVTYLQLRKHAVTTKDKRRERLADRKIAALKGRVPKLTVKVDARIHGLEVRWNGGELNPVSYDTELSVDPGKHLIAASAPGYETWSTEVEIKEYGRETVVVPNLEPKPKPEPEPEPEPPPEVEPAPPQVSTAGNEGLGSEVDASKQSADVPWYRQRRKQIAAGVGVVGATAVVVGGVFGLRARSKWDDAQAAGCEDDGLCPDAAAAELVDEARSSSTVANILIGGGLIAIGGAAVLWLTAPSVARDVETAGIAPLVGADSVGLSWGLHW